MSRECGVCPTLQAQISQLRAEVNQLNRIVEKLRQMLYQLRGEVVATVNFIDREQLEPTMPRKRFIPTIRGRLTNAAENTAER